MYFRYLLFLTRICIQILYFANIFLQVQDLPQDSDNVAETETKRVDLEVSDIDKAELQHNTDME